MAGLYVVSDIHGYLDDFRSSLRSAGLLGDDDTWTGGDARLPTDVAGQVAILALGWYWRRLVYLERSLKTPMRRATRRRSLTR